MNRFYKFASLFALSAVSLTAFAESKMVPKLFVLKSVQGLTITINAVVEEFDANEFGNRNRNLKSLSVTASEFGAFRTVLILVCGARHYPNSWSYQSVFELDANQSSGGAPYVAYEPYSHQLEYASPSGDSDSCRTELALVKNNQWQTDPVNGSHNFILDL